MGKLTGAGHEVSVVSKWRLAHCELSGLDCLYLVLGRDRPSEEEAARELAQVTRYATISRSDRRPRTVYLSSRLDMPHKRECERLIVGMGGIFVRPPAVFGPGQRIDSEMLIPSLVRTGGTLELRNPNAASEFISAGDLAEQLVDLADPDAWAVARESRHLVTRDGLQLMMTLRLTPRQVRDLYLAFASLESRALTAPTGSAGGT